MTRSCLNPTQRWTVDVIEALGFGSIEHLSIRRGSPCCEPEPRVVQTIKLDDDSDSEKRPDRGANLTLKKEFENLFDLLSRLDDATVDIEVRHGVPFRLVLQHRCEALLSK
jgi:hypothetical protein